jgi:hypothetical protein
VNINAYIARTFYWQNKGSDQYKNYKMYAACELTFLDKDKNKDHLLLHMQKVLHMTHPN